MLCKLRGLVVGLVVCELAYDFWLRVLDFGCVMFGLKLDKEVIDPPNSKKSNQ